MFVPHDHILTDRERDQIRATTPFVSVIDNWYDSFFDDPEALERLIPEGHVITMQEQDPNPDSSLGLSYHEHVWRLYYVPAPKLDVAPLTATLRERLLARAA